MSPDRTRPVPTYMNDADKQKLRGIVNKIRILLDCKEVPLRLHTSGIDGVPCFDCRQLAKKAMKEYNDLLTLVSKRKYKVEASTTKTTIKMSSET